MAPRKSFEAWTDMVRGTCVPWSESDVRAAEKLRISLIEIVLKLTDEANAQRKLAAEKQELLTAEPNRRVRNILNLNQGLVSQSRVGVSNIESYTRVLDGRVQSLACAHDQLTRQEWAPSALTELNRVEVDAYKNGQRDRVIVTGDAPLLAPEAFSTMALVIHEPVTNSAKHGALVDQSGLVSFALSIADDGAPLINWRERGGPPVQAPVRRGFGATIIERSIPHELSGTVETHYKLAGLEAQIMVSTRYVFAGKTVEPPRDDVTKLAAVQDTPRIDGLALVLEDNMVIALDASDILGDMGARDVRLAGSVDDALQISTAGGTKVAVLDLNLGNHTSLPVAERLAADGIPFVLATGYGDVNEILAGYPRAAVVQKSFTSDTLTREGGKALRER